MRMTSAYASGRRSNGRFEQAGQASRCPTLRLGVELVASSSANSPASES